MLRAANLFAASKTFVNQALQHGKLNSFAQKLLMTKDSSDSAHFNPDWWAENGDIEFADYSEGADRSSEGTISEEPEAPITIIEETVIVVIE